MKNALSIVICICLAATGIAQPASFWQDKTLSEMRSPENRHLFPTIYRTSTLDLNAFQQFLTGVPQEGSIRIDQSGALFAVPAPDGTMDSFRIVEYSMMEPGLAQRYPEFKTMRGIHIHDPFRTIRCDWTLKGFTAIVSTDEGRYHIEPFARGNREDYIIFYKRDYPGQKEPFVCGTEGESVKEQSGLRAAGDCVFRSYRLAVATTGEYSNHFGATDSGDEGLVLSEVVVAVNRVNGVYEKDFTVRLILIENTTDVFYYDLETDPYNGGACTQLGQNQTTMTNVIGSGNYDIGHVFSTGSGGCAGLGVVCNNSNKARGATGVNPPEGDVFYIDYVAHEMGHQFGGNHTFNNSCGGNRNNSTAYEPGSGSTIMAYAGICTPNVQNNSDDYFHGISVQEINNYISSGTGDNCDTPISLGNTAPVVSPDGDYTIPISTPFMLTATATDADDDPMTFCWEQWDQEIGSMPPSSSNTIGPMFRSFDPDPSPTRYFPRLSDLVDGTDYDWEVLPSVSRSMEFRVTVRDFHNATAGCTDEDNVVVTTSASSGPFVVTAPNLATDEWTEGNVETVTWDVANTTGAPVSCALVDIYLSYDGGFTYPEVLATGVPNDGSQDVTVPAGTSTTARVMVRGNGNIFFDISNEDFEILTGIPTYALSVDPETQTGCVPDFVQYTVNAISINGYTDPVLLTSSGTPSGVTISYSPNPVIPGNTAMMNVNISNGVLQNAYDLTVVGNSIGGMKTATAQLVVGTPFVDLLLPMDEATGLSLAPLVSWEDAGADNYTVEVSVDGFFSEIIFTETTTATEITVPDLEAATTYYWRVQGSNICGAGSWSEIRVFQTGSCRLDYSTDVPKTISSSGSPTITSELEITFSGEIADINVIDLEGTHTWLGDLVFTLTSPVGTDVILIDQWCTSQNNFNINLDDQADPGSPPCPYNDGNTYQPEQALSAFNGESPTGTWVLTVDDVANQDGGALNSWALEICLSDGCVLVVSNAHNAGMGSLRASIECAADGDTITFVNALHNETIAVSSTLLIQDDVYILSNPADAIVIDGSETVRTFETTIGTTSGIEGLMIASGSDTDGSGILNHGNLFLKDVTVERGSMSANNLVTNLGTLTLEGNCEITK